MFIYRGGMFTKLGIAGFPELAGKNPYAAWFFYCPSTGGNPRKLG
jgi:hypothetical protein